MAVEPPVVSPASLAEAYSLLAEAPFRPVAGGTDLMVQLEADVAEPPSQVLDLWRLEELRGVAYD
jgi:CO/xanthine dehydrogenase FAD-binding subunit